MSCEERLDDLYCLAAGALEGAELEALRAHLAAGCPICTGRLAEAEATFSQLPTSLPPRTPRPEVRQRLMDRVAAQSRRAPVKHPRPPGRQGLDWPFALATAAALALLVTSLWQAGQLREQAAVLQKSAEELALLEEKTKDLETRSGQLVEQLDVASRTIEALQSRNVRLVSLAGGETQPRAWAHILWDEERHSWHFFASGLQPAPRGKIYELWFVTRDERKIPAATFDVNAQGRAALEVRVPDDLGPLALAAVTDEPTGGSPQPTGSFQLLGTIQ